MMQKPLTHEMFLDDIDKFCVRHRISAREIGIRVSNNTSLVYRLKKGISPTLETVEAVYDFMIALEAEKEAAEARIG